jgi:hypothetical protein
MLPSLSEILEMVGYGLVLPAVVAAAGVWLALRLGGGEPLGVGAGLAAGFAALAASQSDWRILRPEESWDWLPALGLLAAVMAVGDRNALSRWSGRVVAAALTGVLLLSAQAKRGALPPYLFASLPLIVLILWALLDLAVRRRPGATLPALLTLVAFSAAALGEMGDFLTAAQRGLVVAGTLAGWTFVAWRRPTPGVCRAGVGVLAVLLPGVLFVGAFNRYGDVPTLSYLLVLVAPLCLGAMSLLPFGKPGWRAVLFLAAATLIPLAAALALAARVSASSSDFS